MGIGLHAHPDFQTSKEAELWLVPVDAQPRTWKESLQGNYTSIYGFTSKQTKYQELLYEIILTEQCYVDDLILIYEIFIKEAICWNGLLFPIERLFKAIKRIIEHHLRLLEVHGFDVYFSYFREFEKANTLIQKSIKRQDELGSYLLRRSAWVECKSLPFSAYLLKPIQRIMKYPLFFKSLAECLESNDREFPQIQLFLTEIDKLLRCFEKEKKEAEEFMKLEDLSCRIKGLEGSTVHIAEPKRKLIFEGYLTIIPPNNPIQSGTFSRMSSSTISFASTAETPRLKRRSSTFNIALKKQDRAYVFLFNDLIVCTRERNKRKPVVMDERGIVNIPKKGTYYGPSSYSLFEIIHAPGKITMVDRHVARETPSTGKLPRKGSTFFQSFKRHGSRVNNDEESSAPELSSFPSQQSLSTKQEEEHPLQFVCSIATKNLTNIQFEAETVEQKNTWCDYLESVLKEHVQRDTDMEQLEFSIPAENNDTMMDLDSTNRPMVETGGLVCKHLPNEGLPTLINKLTILNDNNEFYDTLLDEFGDESWITDDS
ncbi:hypothetical protein G6F22_008339 [Rhizopus arrhizus]|nr:hypothetical protein G6F22_008339 [Rhizopus arrhizus]